jgi:Caspase domain
MTTMRRALLVGIDSYAQAPLAGCVNDARAMADILSKHHDGTPNFDVRLLTAPPEKITRAILRDAIEYSLKQPADIALLYFSGHGTENNLGGYLVTQDAAKYDEGVSLVDVLTLVNASPVREIVVMLDSCHSGAMGHIPAVENNKANIREGVSILTASRSSEAAVETGGNGLFTSLVTAAIEGGAADVAGHVTVAGIYAYVDESLGPWDQRPLFKSHVSTLVPIRNAKPAVPIATIRRLPEWFPKPDQEFALDPSYEPDAEPANTLHEEIFGRLQECRSGKLVEPVDEIHMYYAAMRSKACRLTPLGRHYWRLANDGRI